MDPRRSDPPEGLQNLDGRVAYCGSKENGRSNMYAAYALKFDPPDSCFEYVSQP